MHLFVVVLALAYGQSMEDLTFVGMVGLLDPPRDGIQDAVLTLLSTGAHLKMVTGDAEETALAIGNKPHCFIERDGGRYQRGTCPQNSGKILGQLSC